MTPKEKAKELFNKFNFIYSYDGLGIMDDEFTNDDRKECALIAVDEIIKSKNLKTLFTQEQIDLMEGTSDDRWIYETFMKYWKKVKQEIEKL